MLRYLILIGALAAMPLSSFAMVEAVDQGAAETMANVQQSKTEGPVLVEKNTWWNCNRKKPSQQAFLL